MVKPEHSMLTCRLLVSRRCRCFAIPPALAKRQLRATSVLARRSRIGRQRGLAILL